MKIESLGENFLLFKFGSEEEKKKVFTSGPWHFDNTLIVFTEPTGVGDIKKQSFLNTLFWVQLHNVLHICMEKYVIEKLGSLIEKVEEVHTDEMGECIGPIVRVRISMDITKPLKKFYFFNKTMELKPQ